MIWDSHLVHAHSQKSPATSTLALRDRLNLLACCHLHTALCSMYGNSVLLIDIMSVTVTFFLFVEGLNLWSHAGLNVYNLG